MHQLWVNPTVKIHILQKIINITLIASLIEMCTISLMAQSGVASYAMVQ